MLDSWLTIGVSLMVTLDRLPRISRQWTIWLHQALLPPYSSWCHDCPACSPCPVALHSLLVGREQERQTGWLKSQKGNRKGNLPLLFSLQAPPVLLRLHLSRWGGRGGSRGVGSRENKKQKICGTVSCCACWTLPCPLYASIGFGVEPMHHPHDEYFIMKNLLPCSDLGGEMPLGSGQGECIITLALHHYPTFTSSPGCPEWYPMLKSQEDGLCKHKSLTESLSPSPNLPFQTKSRDKWACVHVLVPSPSISSLCLERQAPLNKRQKLPVALHACVNRGMLTQVHNIAGSHMP